MQAHSLTVCVCACTFSMETMQKHMSCMLAGGTGLEKPRIKMAGPALNAHPATGAAARTISVTKVRDQAVSIPA